MALGLYNLDYNSTIFQTLAPAAPLSETHKYIQDTLGTLRSLVRLECNRLECNRLPVAVVKNNTNQLSGCQFVSVLFGRCNKFQEQWLGNYRVGVVMIDSDLNLHI